MELSTGRLIGTLPFKGLLGRRKLKKAVKRKTKETAAGMESELLLIGSKGLW